MLKSQAIIQPRAVERSQGFFLCQSAAGIESRSSVRILLPFLSSECWRMVTVTQDVITVEVLDALLLIVKKLVCSFSKLKSVLQP